MSVAISNVTYEGISPSIQLNQKPSLGSRLVTTLDKKVYRIALQCLSALAALFGTLIVTSAILVGASLSPFILGGALVISAAGGFFLNSKFKGYDQEYKLEEYRKEARTIYKSFDLLDKITKEENFTQRQYLKPLSRLCLKHKLKNILKYEILSPFHFNVMMRMELENSDFEYGVELYSKVNKIKADLHEDNPSINDFKLPKKKILQAKFAEKLQNVLDKKDPLKVHQFLKKFDLEDLETQEILSISQMGELKAISAEYAEAYDKFIKSIPKKDKAHFEKVVRPLKKNYENFKSDYKLAIKSHPSFQKIREIQEEFLAKYGAYHEDSYKDLKRCQDEYISKAMTLINEECTIEDRKFLRFLRESKDDLMCIEDLEKAVDYVRNKESKAILKQLRAVVVQKFRDHQVKAKERDEELKKTYLKAYRHAEEALQDHQDRIKDNFGLELQQSFALYKSKRSLADARVKTQKEELVSSLEGISTKLQAFVKKITA